MLSHYIMQVLQGKNHIPVTVPVKEFISVRSLDTAHFLEYLFMCHFHSTVELVF